MTIVLSVTGVVVGGLGTGGPTSLQSSGQRVGSYIDQLVLPLLLVALVYLIGKYRGGVASLVNVLSAMAWSQLPMLLLSAIALLLTTVGFSIDGPLMANDIVIADGSVRLIPPKPRVNSAAYVFFMFSGVFIFWSFHILVSGLAAVERIGKKQVVWLVTLAFLMLLIIRLPIGWALGDIGVMKVLGLDGIFNNV